MRAGGVGVGAPRTAAVRGCEGRGGAVSFNGLTTGFSSHGRQLGQVWPRWLGRGWICCSGCLTPSVASCWRPLWTSPILTGFANRGGEQVFYHPTACHPHEAETSPAVSPDECGRPSLWRNINPEAVCIGASLSPALVGRRLTLLDYLEILFAPNFIRLVTQQVRHGRELPLQQSALCHSARRSTSSSRCLLRLSVTEPTKS